jgi:4-amino-4-deoxy-L-arabinose transferase-like glycosyltransferase
VRALLVLGLLSIAALFLGLDRPDWIEGRESRDAWIPRELVQRREALTPVLGGLPRYEKPLLAYGWEFAATRLTPDSPAGPRAVNAALAAALVVLTATIGSRWFGRRAGALGGAVLATCLALPMAARSDGTQLLATCLGWLAWLGLAPIAIREPSRARLPIYLALAVTLLVAGPLPALWPLTAALIHARLTPTQDQRPRFGAIAGLLLLVGLGLPWYGAMLERHGGEFVAALPAFPYGGEPGAPWYTAPARVIGFLVVGFFPWSALLPAAVLYRWTAAATADLESNPTAHLLVVTLLVALVPVLFASAAPVTAVLPALPAAALLTGAFLDRAFAGESVASRAIGQGTWLVAGSGTVAAVMCVWIARRLGTAAPELRLVGAFVLVASWAPALATFIGRVRAAPALLALLVAAGAPLVTLRVLPALEDRLSASSVASAMNQVSRSEAPLLVLEPPPTSLLLRLERQLAVPRDLSAGFRDLRDSHGWSYVAFAPRRQSEVARAAAPAPLEILMRTPLLVLARVAGADVQNKLP